MSQSVSNPDAVAQEIVTFLGSRVHGLELGKLRVFIGVPSEISNACGGNSDVLACYSAGERRMYIPDRDPGSGSSAGFTRNYAITHEYGHHIANFRSNAPFPALNFGAKYWSSYKFVCMGADEGRYFPGNQGTHYLDDPGEAFADSYAHLPENGFSNVPWQFNERLRPDAGAFAALRRDVLDPWRGSTRKVVSGQPQLAPPLAHHVVSHLARRDGRPAPARPRERELRRRHLRRLAARLPHPHGRQP